MRVFFNDIDPFCCAVLRRLHPSAFISSCSISSLPSGAVAGYRQVHLFAGIGGWPIALEMAGWPSSLPVWTLSCPCQPFSNAGRQKGTDDERHLWPCALRLITLHRPPVLLGEQVASPLGRAWLAGVRSDLEALGYAFGAADLCAAGLSAPHIRQRLYWVADATGVRCDELPRWEQNGSHGQGRMFQPQRKCTERERVGPAGEPGLEGLAGHGNRRDQPGRLGAPAGGHAAQAGAWSDFRLVECREPTREGGIKVVYRRAPVEPSFFPLADGPVPNRVGALRAIGNGIVPQVASTFIKAYLQCRSSK